VRAVGARLVVAPTDETGEYDLARFEALLRCAHPAGRVTHISNVTGAILPIARIVELAHAKGARVLVDGCQAVPRMPVDVRALAAIYVFSGAQGVWADRHRRAVTAVMTRSKRCRPGRPRQHITSVPTRRTEFLEPPRRFEPAPR